MKAQLTGLVKLLSNFGEVRASLAILDIFILFFDRWIFYLLFQIKLVLSLNKKQLDYEKEFTVKIIFTCLGN